MFDTNYKPSNHFLVVNCTKYRVEYRNKHLKYSGIPMLSGFFSLPSFISAWSQSSSTYQCIILQYLNTGKYCFILQILILELFTEVLLISILMLSIQNLILIYWYFQYFTVSVFYVLNHLLTAVI